MAQPDTFYLCFRPDTKSKEWYARCRQYPFDTTADLLKWLRSRKNSEETIRIEFIKDRHIAGGKVGRRCDLAMKTDWPLP